MRLRPTKLSTRLLLLVLAASMPGLVLLGMDAISRRGAAAEDALRQASRLASQVVATHGSALSSTELLLAGLGALPESEFRDPARCRALSLRLLEIDPRLVNFGAAGPDGEILCSAQPVEPQTTLAGRAWLRQAVELREFVVGDHLVGRIVRRPIAVVAHPRVRDDSVTMVLFASIDLAALTELAASSALPPSSTLTIVDSDGLVLARYPDPEPWVGRRLPDDPMVQEMLAGTESVAAPGFDGIERFYAFRALPRANGNTTRVAVGIPRSATLAEANAALRRSLLTLAFAALIALVLSNVTAERLILRRTEALVRAADRLGAGDLGARSGLTHGPGEFGRLAHAFDAMAATVEIQTEELQHSREELRLLARRTEDEVERERQRISRTVHDELGQAITALKIDASWLEKRLGMKNPAVTERFAAIGRMLDHTSKTVRRIATELRPSVLDDLGLDAAVEWQVNEFCRRTGIAGDISLRIERNGLEPAVTTALFRILQEALTNVARHAAATRVAVRLTETADRAVLEVRDDGRGLPASRQAAEPSLGLLGMRERAQALGGQVVVQGVEPHGTLVRAEIPLDGNGDAAP